MPAPPGPQGDEERTPRGRFELGTDGPRVLVAAVDGSPTAARAGAYALGLSRRQGARLVVVTVVRTPASAGLAPGVAGALESTALETAQELRREVERAASLSGVAIDMVVRHGDPYTEICRACDEVRAEGVVVGASASAGHRLVGSLAVRLVRSGRWPVTVVP